ncbi:helicase-related protein [Anaeromyxobacter terrae]|uniref:helicase-related protein n=1 Tax=Anaeromyxobacter terrae TaxID=2925406 RepID=UPI001F588162|nr:helicase-related protein [Anaeromyxobacter sp. SG22]
MPLLMALKLDPVRLLIGDDVGIGKTIEAGLVARELLDRGEIERFTVLCPPHLVDQWLAELEDRFHIRAVAVTAGTANRLERDLPQTESIFSVHRFTVVSLDYIKSDRRRDDFLRACPELVIVDEAHTCAAPGAGRHQRYELLKGLVASGAAAIARHLVMLTATPHSGDEDAFYRLLGLIDARFGTLKDASGKEREELREALSRHFVQRRRPDLDEWKEGHTFPKRETKELTYQLTGAWDRFFEGVLDYCAAVVEAAGGDERRRRLNFWGTLALMRCVASSPAAGAQALRSRARAGEGEFEEDALEERIFDGSSDVLVEDDVEPPLEIEDRALAGLIDEAEKLAGQSGDPKLKLLTDHLGKLIDDGFNPVVFCRYIATAHYLAKHLEGRFGGVKLAVVTGELTSDERKERVEDMGEAERRLLVATDCLSEGVNLQGHFDAVVHYDLSWNPTRHEQREGRVDRFGQKSPVVRATLIYGANNPVDGAVLEVILRKAEKIRQELGVPVPLPDESHSLTQALMRAVFLRHKSDRKQRVLDFSETPEARAIDDRWRDAAIVAKANRTVFAQRRLRPDDVLPEWQKTLSAIGGEGDVERFTGRSLARLGSGLEPLSSTKRRGFKAALAPLPEDVRERLEAEGLTGAPLVDFATPPAPRCRAVQRSHPLVAILAETLLERTLADVRDDAGNGEAPDAGVLGRIGCWVSKDVSEQTTVALLRLRHQLTARRGRVSTLLVEEAAALAWGGVESPRVVEGLDALKLLTLAPLKDPPARVVERVLAKAVNLLSDRIAELEAFTRRRAEALLADHRRVREAADARGSWSVKALLPPDVVGVYVLLPGDR